ncbi:hypothetical protein L3Y34_009549 [Caenorhabditis briggsae]|uniref:Lin-15A/B-like domain-containing protein n=1 Tax=Caenorhabditis briggsae TaxID=6238 RepID=A0AAE9A4F5_CAEBR|nr:hypothetical protein L3Y34_009549 [Caenorhabditis briggsae]
MEQDEWNQPTSSESSNFQKFGISGEEEKPVEENNRLIGFKCFECGKVSKLEDFQAIENRRELLVIVIGWVLNGLSLRVARAILKEKPPQLMCHEHFEATILKIFEALKVSKSSDIIKSTTYVGTALIHTAQSLCPQLSIYELKSLFFNFCAEHKGGSHSKSAKNRTAEFLQKTVPKNFLIQENVEDKSEQSGSTPQNGSRPAESEAGGPIKILIPRILKSKAEQSGKIPAGLSYYSTPETSEQSGQQKVRPADTSNAIAQFLTENRDIKIRRVVKRKAEQSWGALTSSEGSRMLGGFSYATSSASESQKFQNDPKKVVIRNYVGRNTVQSSTSSSTISSKPRSSGGSEISCSSFFTSSGPVCTASERQKPEFSPGTSTETRNEQSIPEILSQWNVKIEPEEEQKPEEFRPPEEYPSFKILEEVRKSGEPDSSELRFDYTETEEKVDNFVIKIEPKEGLKSERIWDEQCLQEVKEEVNDEQFLTTSSEIKNELCDPEVKEEIDDEQCPMASTSSGIRHEQCPTTSSASEIMDEKSDLPIDTYEIDPNFSPETTKCPICNQPKSIIDLVPLVGKYEKLVVLISWVIDGFPIEQAISLLNSEEFDFVCLEHPISTVTKLFEYLNVSSIEQLQKINIGPNHNLATAARSISLLFSIGLQRTIFKFSEKFESQESYNQFVMDELERREIEGFVDQMKCVVCRKEEAKDLRRLGDSEEKLIFLSAFLDKITVGTARSIYKSNGAFRACDSHFEGILKRTFEILPVSQIVDIKKCSIQESHPWMSDVRKLRSDITSNQYLDILHGFCARNGEEDRGDQHTIQSTSENCEMPEKCVICQKVKSRLFLRKMDHFIEKLIVFTGWILTDKKAEIRAVPLLNEQNLFVCWSHFPEFSGRIFIELCIKNLHQLSTCYRFLVEKLMITINILVPNMKQDEFLDEFRKWLTASDWCKPQTYVQSNEVLKNKKKHFTCSLCHKKIEGQIGRVESREDKLILMIAAILDHRFEMDIAASFVRSRREFIVCSQHFQSAIDRIFLFLSIKHMNQLSMCRQDLMQNLMVVVRNLNGTVRITTNEFENIMSAFHKNHCRRMNPLPKCPTRPHIRK